MMTDSNQQVNTNFARMKEINIIRKAFQLEIFTSIRNQLTEGVGYEFNQPKHLKIFLSNKPCGGVAGPIASSLLDSINQPVIVLYKEDGKIKGSCRSVRGVHIERCLSAVNKGVLERFGGHSGAAGLSMIEEMLGEFIFEIDNAVSKETPELLSDAVIVVEEHDILDESIIQEIQEYAPFGNNWKEPIVMLKGVVLTSNYKIVPRNNPDVTHTSYGFKQNRLKISGFHYLKTSEIDIDTKVDVTGSMKLEKNGKLSMFVKEIKESN